MVKHRLKTTSKTKRPMISKEILRTDQRPAESSTHRAADLAAAERHLFSEKALEREEK